MIVDLVVKGNEIRCFQYDPQTKIQIMECSSPRFQRHTKFPFKRSIKTKVMLATFLDCQGIIHTKFVPPDQTVFKEHYVEILSRLFKKPIEEDLCVRKEETVF
jgi:hypothetical protein